MTLIVMVLPTKETTTMQSVPRSTAHRQIHYVTRHTLADGRRVVVPHPDANDDVCALIRDIFETTEAITFEAGGATLEGREVAAFTDALIAIADNDPPCRRKWVALAWTNDIVAGAFRFADAS